MTAIIDGTNGVTTPNVLTSSSGVALTLQSGGTTAVTVDTSQNVGIGVTSPSTRLDVRQSTASDLQLQLYNNNAGVYATSIKLVADNATGSNYNSIQSYNAATAQWQIGGAGSSSTIVFGTGSSFTERARVNAYGIGLGGAVPSSGTGIAFPATQSASSDANTLDDYEEGTFTPTIIGTTSAGTGTYSNQTGSYIKVGQLVSIYIRMDWSAHTGTGYLAFAGLPFTSAGTYNNGAALNGMAGLTVAASCYVAANVNTSSTTGYFLQIPVGGGSDSQLAMDTGAIVIFTLTYRASA
jgi:hypothetical protein